MIDRRTVLAGIPALVASAADAGKRRRQRRRRRRRGDRPARQRPAGPPAVPFLAPANGDPVVLAAGDVATCFIESDEATARVLDAHEGAVLMLGDGVQDEGTLEQYERCYHPTWGRHFDRTLPVPGNHEYNVDPRGNPYWDYWGERGGVRHEGWYARDMGAWRLYFLNAVFDWGVLSPETQARQEAWLREDLAAHPAAHVLAAYHYPLVSDGNPYPRGYDRRVRRLFSVLYDAGASVVLNGHRHMVEAHAPMDPDGRPDPAGPRCFVVGTGGERSHPFTTNTPTSDSRNRLTKGVMRLVLRNGGYDWAFLPVAGGTYTTHGSAACPARR